MLTNPTKSMMTYDDMERIAFLITCSALFVAVVFVVIFGGDAP